MKARDLAELATRNLRESALRNLLTTLGIGVGVASLVAMLSLGVGLQQLVTRSLTRSGLFDSVLVFSQAPPNRLNRPRREASPAEARPVDEKARREIEHLPYVVEVYPEIRGPVEVTSKGQQHTAALAGVPLSSRANDAFAAIKGRFFSGAAADEGILQDEFARELSDKPDSLIGQEITVDYAGRQTLGEANPSKRDTGASSTGVSPAVMGEHGQAARATGYHGQNASVAAPWGFSVLRRQKKLRVVGIVEAEPGIGPQRFGRARLFIPVQVAESLDMAQLANLASALRDDGGVRTYQALTARVADPVRIQAIEDAIKKMGFGTFSLLDATQNLRRFFAVLDLFLGIFGSLALTVASLGIINTLVMAILERRREIGIMKALGASDADVRKLFFVEAGAMGLLGGLLGVALGWSIGRVIDLGTEFYLKQQNLPPPPGNIWSVPWWLVAGAIGFSILVSLISGLYPAARAARLDPVQALRYE